MPRGTMVANIYKKLPTQSYLPHLFLALSLSDLSLSHPERRHGATQRDAPVHGGGGPGEIPPGVLHHVEYRLGGPNRLDGAAEHSEEVEAGEVEVIE